MFLELCADVARRRHLHGRLRRATGPRAGSPTGVHSSFLQRLRPSARTFRALLPLYPAAIESFDLSGYDLVVSSSSAWAHAVAVRRGHGPRELLPQPVPLRLERPRQTLARRNPVTRAFLRGAFRRWRQWDWIAAQRTDSLRRQLADHAGADPRLLRPRGRHRPSAGRHLALLARSGRRPLRGGLRADAPQADRRRDRGVQPAAPAADRRRRRPGGPGAAAARRARRSTSPAACPTRRWPRCSRARGR